jgi:REP element-mobilizing transposase RayT
MAAIVINGMPDHVHSIISMSPKQALSDLLIISEEVHRYGLMRIGLLLESSHGKKALEVFL